MGRATTIRRSRPIFLKFQSTPSVGRATLSDTVRRLREELFQSTPSVGRATRCGMASFHLFEFQSTPSVGRATKKRAADRRERPISIHALRGEGDRTHHLTIGIDILFQSTPSVGRATWSVVLRKSKKTHFNPRPPWGGRPPPTISAPQSVTFQSTPSVGRATRWRSR